MKPIIIHYGLMDMVGLLIREDNPRIGIVQDRIVLLDKSNEILQSIDMLTLFTMEL